MDGDPQNRKWILWSANGTYLIGSFDGCNFVQEGDAQKYEWGGDSYAAQTWSDIPSEDGRRIQIAWLRARTLKLPNMPFSQQMTFPCELTLRSTEEGVSLFSIPVKEIEGLRSRTHIWRKIDLAPRENPLSDIQGELFDICAELQAVEAEEFGFVIRGIPIACDVKKGEISCQGKTAPLRPTEGKIRLRVLVDRISIEIFGNDGRIALPVVVIPDDANTSLIAYSHGGTTRIISLEVHELRSAWEKYKQDQQL